MACIGMVSLFVCAAIGVHIVDHVLMINDRLKKPDPKEKARYLCSDGVIRDEDKAIAFEESLFSGESPVAPWNEATTRMRG